jgi:hypothetical protein
MPSNLFLWQSALNAVVQSYPTVYAQYADITMGEKSYSPNQKILNKTLSGN